ncbi:MAG: pyridoxal phosphate-dependent aminotransferase [Alphaproteobacteria bacterium]|tara:strand:+ start:362 stop:1531 length:1170 start_codon:yes stop_codon:yes gene_type:complete
MDGLNKSMYDIGSDSAFSILARSQELARQGKEVINLGIGQPDFPTPTNVVNAAIKALKDGHHGYTSSNGIYELRKAVADDFLNRNKISVDPNQILITPGGKSIIFYTMLMFGEVGSEIITPDPGFIAYKSMIDYTGAKAVCLPHRMENNFSFQAEELLSLINDKTKLIILNSPANPTGGVVPQEELTKLAVGLEKFPNVYVLSDEIYSRILFDNHSHHSLLSYNNIKDRVIVLDGWSKTYSMTGWRLGYGIFPKKIFSFAEKLAINCHSCVNSAAQFAGIEALTGSQDSVNKMIEEFKVRRDFLVKELNNIKNVECKKPGGAFYVFPKVIKENLSSIEISRYLLENKFIATVPGSSFGDKGEGFLRISYANTIDNLKKFVYHLNIFMNE